MKQITKIDKTFPESRFRHCHSVGLKMYYYSLMVQGKDELYAGDMYVLGVMHDIGYFLNPDPFLHDKAMYDVLVRASEGYYRYAIEILYHSRYQEKYDSSAMRLLYYADTTVDAYGNWVTFEDRLKDIENRYGKESEVYAETLKIAEKCREWGFDDTFGLS